jgi:hypothetical protein
MDYFTKWSEVYALPNQDTYKVTDALINVFRRFVVSMELHSNQCRNFE